MNIRNIQNVVLLLTSIAFYAFLSPMYSVGLIIMILVNFLLGISIEKGPNSKLLFTFAIIFNLSIMILLKYLDFLDFALKQMLDIQLEAKWQFVVPIGLSFFILRAIGYHVDIYRLKIHASKNLIEMGAYFAFFPTIVAGPLIGFGEFQEQLKNRQHTFKRFSSGICRFVVGLAKKVIIANNLGMMVNQIFDLSTIGPSIYSVPASLAWLGIIAFSLYIYFDFSGYCDMAIGISLVFGFKLPENFKYPYAAKSLTQFWSRWNATVMAWFDEYVFMSLNKGTRKNKDVIIRNMFILWIIIGLWYGANWNFLLWGVWNGFFLIAEEFLNLKDGHLSGKLYYAAMNLVLILGWVVFRSKDLYQAGIYAGNMFCLNNNGIFSDIAFMYIKENFLLLIVAMIFCMPIVPKINGNLINEPLRKGNRILTIIYPIAMLMLFIFTLILISVMGFGNFAFYRF
ncbi:MAG: MBOAT family protein [Aminipila sp.]